MVGIIGGMGSYAGMDLLSYAISKSNAKIDSDFPRILYYNLPIEGMNETGLKDEKKVFSQLRSSVDNMQRFGCDRIVIACNSAHSFWGKLQGMTPATILNMVDIGANACCGRGPVGVLCSESTKMSGLYDSYLDRYKTPFIHTDQGEQGTVNEVIGNVIRGEFKADGLIGVCSGLISRGAKTILAGCTEVELSIRKSSHRDNFVFPGVLTVDVALG